MSSIVSDITVTLDRASIKHWLLRQRHGLSSKNGDKDFLVSQQLIDTAGFEIKKLLRKQNIILLKDVKKGYHRYLQYWHDGELDTIHLQSAVIEANKLFFTAEELFSKWENELILPTEVEASLICLRNIANIRQFAKPHTRLINILLSESNLSFEQTLITMFDETIGRKLFELLSRSDFGGVLNLHKEVVTLGRPHRYCVEESRIRKVAIRLAQIATGAKGPVLIECSSLSGNCSKLPHFLSILNLKAIELQSTHGRFRKALNHLYFTALKRLFFNPLIVIKGRDSKFVIQSFGSKESRMANSLVVCVEVLRHLFDLRMIRAQKTIEKLLPFTGSRNIAFIGLDGSGKSTMISHIQKHFEQNSLSVQSLYLGYGEYRLDIMRKVVKEKNSAKSRLYRRGLSFTYFLLLPIEMAFRRGLGRCDILLLDRHPLFEPLGKRLWRLQKLLELICPCPHTVIFLNGDSEKLWRRKQEGEYGEYVLREQALAHIVREKSAEISIQAVNSDDSIVNTYEEIKDILCRE